MKNSKVLFLSTILGASLLWVSCQKNTTEQQSNPETAQYVKNFGALQVSAEEMSKVPLIMSSDLAKGNIEPENALMASAKGKPYKPPTTTSDATAPTVSITSPSNGSTVSGTVTVSISASDNVGVTSISATAGGTNIGSSANSSASFSWSTSGLADGNYIITATAKDAAGNTGTYSITVGIKTTIVVQPPTSTTLPSSYALVMPPVMNQGSEGSCVAFAAVYARSYETYKRTGATSYSQSTNILSPEYLFNQTKTSATSCSGSALITTFDFLKNNGVCTWTTMPYTWTDCSTMPNSTQTAQAANYRIASYSQIYASDVTAIKNMLVANRPLVSQYSVDNEFYNATTGFIWKSLGTVIGYHALAICGYDDAKHAYKVINQWGTSWGDAGYSWIDYDLLPKVSSNLLVMNF
jgi:hypothetical protein